MIQGAPALLHVQRTHELLYVPQGRYYCGVGNTRHLPEGPGLYAIQCCNFVNDQKSQICFDSFAEFPIGTCLTGFQIVFLS